MTYVIILWSCALGQPLCTHPDATWSGHEYRNPYTAMFFSESEHGRFRQVNTTREVIKFEVMTRERWEFERSSYNCSRLGGAQ